MDRYVRYFLRVALAATFPLIAVGSLLYSPASQSDQSTNLAALLDQSLDGSQRSASNRARDAARHPKQTLLFFGLRPNQSVVEIATGGGWHTEVLAHALRERGMLYAMDLPGENGGALGNSLGLNSRHASETGPSLLLRPDKRISLIGRHLQCPPRLFAPSHELRLL